MRPRYHYAPAVNWLSDPNGLVYDAGEWHLFYQYNPQGEDWGHMSWGHAVSADLVNWDELPVALVDDDQHMIFSGSAVVDPNGAAGFGEGAMIAIYTAARAHGPAHQAQALAWSGDRGRTWQHYAANPVLDRDLADFRDPNVFWHEATARWIMVVALSAENRALIYASHDLRQWDELSIIYGAEAPGSVWECPLLIEVPVEGSDETRWLFKVDVLHDGPGSGAIYQTGTFDGITFRPDGTSLAPLWQIADYGSDFYAAIAWHEPRDALGRPAWIGWMGNHAYQGSLPRQGWRGAMSLPRRISLVRVGDRYELRQQIEPIAAAQVPTVPLESGQCAVAARLALPANSDGVVTISDAAGRSLTVERAGGELRCTRRDPHAPCLDRVCTAAVSPDKALELWLDAGSIELVDADGGTAMTLQHRMVDARLTISSAVAGGGGR